MVRGLPCGSARSNSLGCADAARCYRTTAARHERKAGSPCIHEAEPRQAIAERAAREHAPGRESSGRARCDVGSFRRAWARNCTREDSPTGGNRMQGTILIIDDDIDTAAFLVEMLRRRRFDASAVHSAD